MLVLSRQKEQSIIIGDDIKVMVIETRFDKVRLGIEAPKNIPVHREEIWLQIQADSKASADAGQPDS